MHGRCRAVAYRSRDAISPTQRCYIALERAFILPALSRFFLAACTAQRTSGRRQLLHCAFAHRTRDRF